MSGNFRGTRNKLTDLNDHLFEQLERLKDESLDQDSEIKRAEAMASISEQILKTHIVEQKSKEIHIKAAEVAYELNMSQADVLGIGYSNEKQ